jgi:hypothetical protein
MNWLAVVPFAWLALLAYSYSRIFNQWAVRPHHRKEGGQWPPQSPARR